MDFDFQKIVQILAYLCKIEGGRINYTKAIKIIFFSDKLFLKRFGRTITSDNYSALKNGPIPSNTLDVVKMPEEFNEEYINRFILQEGYDIKKISEPDLDFLAKKEIDTINEIYSLFGTLSYSQLIEKTHKYYEWKIHKEMVENGNSRTMNIEDFFRSSIGQDEVFDMPQDEVDMAKDIYSERLAYA